MIQWLIWRCPKLELPPVIIQAMIDHDLRLTSETWLSSDDIWWFQLCSYGIQTWGWFARSASQLIGGMPRWHSLVSRPSEKRTWNSHNHPSWTKCDGWETSGEVWGIPQFEETLAKHAKTMYEFGGSLISVHSIWRWKVLYVAASGPWLSLSPDQVLMASAPSHSGQAIVPFWSPLVM